MRHATQVEHVKCDGCARTITDGLGGLANVRDVEVDVASGTVRWEGPEDLQEVARTLNGLGYPVKGTAPPSLATRLKLWGAKAG